MIGLEDYIRRTVDAAPPLTPEQRDRLAILLRGQPPRRTPETPSAAEIRRRALEVDRAQAERDAKRQAAEILACAYCGHPPTAHDSHLFSHAWQPKLVPTTREQPLAYRAGT